MSTLSSYTSLSSKSNRDEVRSVLNSIINGFVRSEDTGQLAAILIKDIETCIEKPDEKIRISPNEINAALLSLKMLGRSLPASVIISERNNFHILLKVMKALYKSNTDAAYDALRCVANALLLVEESRDTWARVQGADYCMELLEETKSPVCIFLCSRILFLCTVSPSSKLLASLLGSSPEGPDVVAIMSKQLVFLLKNLSTLPFSREAMTDLLKFAFNALCHWPKIDPQALETSDHDEGQGQNLGERVLGECWSRRLDGILPSLLFVFNELPTTSSPLVPPMTHILHSLLPIPVDEILISVWFSNIKLSGDLTELSLIVSNNGLRPEAQKRNEQKESTIPKVVIRGADLLDTSLLYYLPGNVDPDDASVKQICQKDDVQLDHVLPPLLLLIIKLCKSDQSCRKYLRQRIIPPDLDRSSPLESHADTLGRCIRLMACVNYHRLKDVAGDLLFVICDSDAQVLSHQIGYGNAAGFLFNKGILSGPPEPSKDSTKTLDPSVNPITGMINRDEPKSLPEMSEEEKEREAEKLFVLFERLEKSSGMENPLKKALHEGKLEKYKPKDDDDSY